jgi:hypothetical protein
MAILTGPQFFIPSGGDTKRSTVQEAQLGSKAFDALGNEYTYVRAGATIAVNDAVRLNADYGDVRSTSATQQGVLGAATAAFAANDYGYILSRGRAVTKVQAGTAANALLASQATAGTLLTGAATDVVTRGAVAVTAEAAGLATVLYL